MYEILVIDDDVVDFKPGLEHALKEYELHWAANGRDGLKILSENQEIGVVLLDIKMPPDFASTEHREGMEILKRIREEYPELPVIMLTVMTDVDLVVEAIQAGAFHYIPKPLDRDKLRDTVRRALENTELKQRIDTLTQAQDAAVAVHGGPAARARSRFHDMIGAHPLMQSLYNQIERVASFDNVKVVLFGETGSGKDLAARAIHQCSERRGKPFRAVNCAAFSETVLDSELFGHEKGAFTSAESRRDGVFISANGGTLFLDEIAETSPALQSKLLRAIENGEIRPVGSDKPVKVDVRFICATNKNLVEERQKGAFREDLYYRLCELPLSIPPLRNRREDIPLLMRHFLKETKQPDALPPKIERGAMQVLMEHDWPGNVRELSSVVKKLVILAGDGKITVPLVREALNLSRSPVHPPSPPPPVEKIASSQRDQDVVLNPRDEEDGAGYETDSHGLAPEPPAAVPQELPEIADLGEFRNTHGEIRLKQVLEQAIRDTGSARAAMEALNITENSYGSFRKWLERLEISVRDLKGYP